MKTKKFQELYIFSNKDGSGGIVSHIDYPYVETRMTRLHVVVVDSKVRKLLKLNKDKT